MIHDLCASLVKLIDSSVLFEHVWLKCSIAEQNKSIKTEIHEKKVSTLKEISYQCWKTSHKVNRI